jgi:hypothetical protein
MSFRSLNEPAKFGPVAAVDEKEDDLAIDGVRYRRFAQGA